MGYQQNFGSVMTPPRMSSYNPVQEMLSEKEAQYVNLYGPEKLDKHYKKQHDARINNNVKSYKKKKGNKI